MADDLQMYTDANISVMAIGGIYCLIFLVFLIFKFISNSDNKNIRKILVILTICHTLTWFIRFIASMTTYISTSSNLDNNHDHANYTICVMVILHPITYYSLTVLRMHYAFGTTGYGLTRTEMLLIFLSAATCIIATMIEQASWIIVIKGNEPVVPIDDLITYLWIWVSFDIVTRMLLVYLFVRKLFCIFMLSDTNKEMSNISRSGSVSGGAGGAGGGTNDIAAKPTVEMNMIQIQFLGVIKKIALLGIISAIPLTISRLVLIFDFVAKDGLLDHRDWLAFNTLQMIAVFIEILAIYLTFKFNQTAYFILCKYCDVCCNKCCTKEAERIIKKEIELGSQTSIQTPSYNSSDSHNAYDNDVIQ